MNNLIEEITKRNDEMYQILYNTTLKGGYKPILTFINGINCIVGIDEKEDVNIYYARFVWNCYAEGKKSPFLEIYTPFNGSIKTYNYEFDNDYMQVIIDKMFNDYNEFKREMEDKEEL